MKKQCFTVFLMLMTLIIFVSACKGDKPKPTADTAGAAKKELILAIGGEPETGFDPTTGWGRYGSPLFQSTLLKRDSKLNIVPDLADSWQVSTDGLIWTVKLKSGVKFSDGQPLTAADVQYTYETAAKSGSSIDLSNMGRVEADGELTVRFTLKEPQSTFAQMLVSTGIVPKHAHGKDYALKPVGSGPFKLVQWDKGQQLIVEANPEYYGTTPFFQRITFLFLNEDAAFAAAKAGTVDMAAIPAAFSKQTVPGMELAALPTADNRGIMFPYVKAGGKTAEGYPIGNDVTADPAIRKAINMALDRKALVEGILEGHGTPAYTLNDGLPWFNPEAVIKDADMDGAQKLLAESGWLDTDKDGILEKGALKAQFNLLYPSNDVSRQSLAIAAADMLKPLGIQVKVEGKSWDEIEKQMHANAVLLGWGSHDPLEMYNVYSAKFGGVEYYNPGFYNNPTVEGYMTKALHSTNEKEAWDYWKKAQWDGTTGLSARGDAPWAWLVNLDHLYLVKSGLDIGQQKVHPHGHGWPVTDNIEEWRWKP